MGTQEGIWLSINDYSQFKKTSISTIRRHIKGSLLKYKEEGGKYFIWVNSAEKIKIKGEEESLRLKLEIEELKSQIRQLVEKNNELKMLVDLYENKNQLPWITEINLPELPKL